MIRFKEVPKMTVPTIQSPDNYFFEVLNLVFKAYTSKVNIIKRLVNAI